MPVELLRELLVTHGLDARSVERIQVLAPPSRGTAAPAATYARGPFSDRHEAASSLPFQLAALLLDGGRTDHARYEPFHDPAITDLIPMIDLVFAADDATWTAVHVRLRTKDGREPSNDGTGCCRNDRWSAFARSPADRSYPARR